MNKTLQRILSWVLAAVLAGGAVPAVSLAEEAGTTIAYYTGVGSNRAERSVSVFWRDDCFTRSSFLGCSHLAELSIEAAIASARYPDA